MVDSDLGGCKDIEKSTSGLILMLNGGPVVWRSTRQTTASTGTTEAESKAATFIGQHTHWHKDFLSELGFPQPPVRLLEDNLVTFVVLLLIMKGLLIAAYAGSIKSLLAKMELMYLPNVSRRLSYMILFL